jgi:hypothetical protein
MIRGSQIICASGTEEAADRIRGRNRTKPGELLYGNGCKHHPAELGKNTFETGCFTCPLKDCIRNR